MTWAIDNSSNSITNNTSDFNPDKINNSKKYTDFQREKFANNFCCVSVPLACSAHEV